MLYQKLLTGDTPYHVSCTSQKHSEGFEEHRHPEAEFIYCFEGVYSIVIDKVHYTVGKDTLALVPPMSSHEILGCKESNTKLVIEAGPSLLKRNFDIFSKTRFTSNVLTLEKGNPEHEALKSLFFETAELYKQKSQYSELMITGNIYKIFALILSQFTEISESITKNMKAVANIDKALELISKSYAEPLTVDMAAEITGYGKSNFCKIFKSIVGDTFHNILNRKRIENAIVYLEETAMPIAEIAVAVGFTDVKSFCRVFKSITGKTAGEARKIKNL